MSKNHELRMKILYSVMIVMIYQFGKCIPIPGTVLVASHGSSFSMQTFMFEALGSDRSASAVLSLGLMPWMTASILFQVFYILSGKDRNRIAPSDIARRTRIAAFIIALFQGFVRCLQLNYQPLPYVSPDLYLIQRLTALVTLVAGAFVVIWLAERNEANGIGGQSLLILVNVVTTVVRTILTQFEHVLSSDELIHEAHITGGILVFSIIVIHVAIMYEKTELRFPVSRAMINNDLAADDYIAIKLNPIGSMAVMYVMSFFTMPYYILLFINWLFPGIPWVQYWIVNLNLDHLPGILVFCILFWLLSIVMGLIFINPGQMAENLQESGNFIIGYRPGRSTKELMTNCVIHLALFSAMISSLYIAAPLLYRILANRNGSIYMLPMTLMILTGIVLGLLDEVQTERIFTEYQPVFTSPEKSGK